MTALLPVPSPTSESAAGPRAVAGVAGGWTIELHGVDPATGRRATWRVSRLPGDDACRVERAEGDITHPAVWMQAARTSWDVTEAEAFALVRDVAGG